ncbi:uncharacterized protein HGUI_01643 [Hanseniaspora guilliermondii]|uniref:Putative lipoate-protein ligase A n=1 Tax=Hanseniaspora guilliermondii TaxID=56406 RepID=A0A1L0B3B2_9ASCO|nr:uncharacterized protein HGUI_01643 [Hanseniaspora guilliermondii]
MNKLNYFLLRKRLNTGLACQQRTYSNYFDLKNTPFENVKSNIKEHADVNDLNNMYTKMFYSQGGSKEINASEKDVNDLDSINREINEFFGTPTPETSYEENANIEEIESPQKFIELIKSDSKFCIVSKSTDPIYNLSMEDFIFRNTPIDKSNLASTFKSQRLMLYVNEKTCVFGKNQNPFKEVNLKSKLLKKNGGAYNLVRRYSGGGTVVHDTGNVNYSYLTSRNEFDQKFFNSFIVNLVNKHLSLTQTHVLDVPIDIANAQKNYLSLNERGDITCNGYKVSGSAFKIALNKSYHHGTMLINSNLKEFSKIMRPKLKKSEVTNNGIRYDLEEFSEETDVNSVRSPIENLKILTGDVLSTPEQFIQILVNGFKTLFSHSSNIKTYSISPGVVNFVDVYEACRDLNLKNTSKGFVELATEDWTYRHTPSFKYTNKKNGFYYRVKKGVVVDTNDTENKIELNKTLFKEDFMV